MEFQSSTTTKIASDHGQKTSSDCPDHRCLFACRLMLRRNVVWLLSTYVERNGMSAYVDSLSTYFVSCDIKLQHGCFKKTVMWSQVIPRLFLELLSDIDSEVGFSEIFQLHSIYILLIFLLESNFIIWKIIISITINIQ